LHDKTGWDEYVAWNNRDQDDEFEWWDYAHARENLLLIQIAINLYPNGKAHSRLAIKNIIKTDDGYIVIVRDTSSRTLYNNRWIWKDLAEGELFTILLIPDGDYIDLYYKDTNTLIDTFVFTSVEFKTQLENLIRGNPVDLSRITWPTRGTASIALPLPPSPAITQEIQQPADTDNTATENQSDTEKNSMPFWAWLAIGAVVAAVGAVFVIKRKK
jgi:hypothetical protein